MRVWGVVFFAGFLVLAGAGAFAQVQPADSAIKNALFDIQRAEQQIGGLTPSRGANIKRLQRSLALTEQRLQASPNKSDPSYADAAARLARLKQALADLAAGRMPGTAAAPAQASPSAPAASAPAIAAPASPPPVTADPALAAAQQDLARIGGALDAMPAGDKAQLKRYRDDLNAVAARLNQLPNKQDPAWAAAAQNYNTLNQRLNAMVAAAQQGGVQNPRAAAPAQNKSDPNVARAEREIGLIKRQLGTMRPGDQRISERFLKDLDRIDAQLAAVADKSQAAWVKVKAQHAQVRTAIVDGVVKSQMAELRKVVDRVNRLQPLQYLVAKDVASVRGGLADIQGRAEALTSPENPNVQALMKGIADIGAAFEGRVQKAEAEHGKLGDVAGHLAAVDQRVRRMRVPRPLNADASEADIRDFAAAVQAVKAHIGRDLAYLNSIEGKTPLTVEQRNKFRFAKNELGFAKPRALEQAMAQSTHAVDARVASHEDILAFTVATDPLNPEHMANRLLGKSHFEQYQKQLTDGIAVVALAAAFDTATARANPPDRAAQKKAFEDGVAAWKEKYRVALDGSRMPEAKSTDGTLLKAAAEVLARPQYGHKYERMVVNYDIHRKEKTTGDINPGTVSTTVTVYHYVWDEFQVTTAEQEGDEFYLFFNRMRFYHKGDNDTPTNKWILSGRHQGHKILKKNIGK